jgi:pimeloyl-ACP methyl ester carboxylesterase
MDDTDAPPQIAAPLTRTSGLGEGRFADQVEPEHIDRGSGPMVLLLHGQPGTGASWTPVIDCLVGRNRVVAPDRPGYGSSTAGPVGMEENADLMAELLRSRSGGPAIVVGHSWSGGVALLMAVRHPDVVRGLVLAGAVGSPDSVNGLDRLFAAPVVGDVLTVAALAGIGMVLPSLRAAVVDRSRHSSQPDGGHRSKVSTARRYLAASMPDEAARMQWATIKDRGRRTFKVEQRALLDELPAVTAVLASIDIPVTVVVGDWDVVVPPTAATSLAAAIPQAELVRIPEVGHFLARDATEQLVEIIEATGRRADRCSGAREPAVHRRPPASGPGEDPTLADSGRLRSGEPHRKDQR